MLADGTGRPSLSAQAAVAAPAQALQPSKDEEFNFVLTLSQVSIAGALPRVPTAWARLCTAKAGRSC